jgi:hypothetical protein
MLRTAADFASGGGEQREAEGVTRIGQDFAIELAQVWPQKNGMLSHYSIASLRPLKWLRAIYRLPNN